MALIFLDLDNTVLYQGKPAKGVKETIDLLKKNNHIVVIATGRNPNLIYGIDQELGIENMVMANGGIVIFDNKIIRENYIDNSVVKRMMDVADEEKFDLVIEYLDEYVSYRKDTSASDDFSRNYNLSIARLDHKFYPNRYVFAMLVFSDDVVKKISPLFPELQFNKSSHYGYDVNPSGGLKADGIKAVIDYLKYPLDDIYAIGDNFNDILMIKSVKHGIAMGNAVDELKQAAEFVTSDVLDNGIYNAMKHYNLI
ncbi:MAG: Cof-type HAD-IIB family hydrolase [Candidatus Izemoplasmatales bacterium]|jgi:Cof subfamily protein (haloacid dehalogenase superfamily)|nr:Cof-type HAD-IIB family hydrolase [Candidatus Izemoplasmatales bacterium]